MCLCPCPVPWPWPCFVLRSVPVVLPALSEFGWGGEGGRRRCLVFAVLLLASVVAHTLVCLQLSVIGLNCTCKPVRSEWFGWHSLGPCVISGSAVAWGYLVPLPFLSFLFFLCWVRACLWWGFAWDVSFLCGVYVCVLSHCWLCARLFLSLPSPSGLSCRFSFLSCVCVVSRFSLSASFDPSLRSLGFL